MRMTNARRRWIGLAVVAFIGVSMGACGSDNQPTPSPAAQSTAIAITPTTVPTATAVPTATPAPTATAVSTSSPQQTALTITDAQATELATQGLASNPDALPVPVANPRVTFTRETIKLAADAQGQSTRLEVLGTPEVVGERVRFKLTALKLNGLDVPFFRQEAEDAINGIFARMLGEQRVESVQLGDGTLTVVPAQ